MKYLAIDQYGSLYPIDKHPRKELLEQLGMTHAVRMYCDMRDGSVRHRGYVIGRMWFTVYRISEAWPGKAVFR